jgi:hypothetical protein
MSFHEDLKCKPIVAFGFEGSVMSAKKPEKRWIKGVKTVSTFPPPGTFTKDAESVARIMASKKVSPRGLGSGIQMIQYFINRAGKDLPPGRKRELEKAKRILQERLKKDRGRD